MTRNDPWFRVKAYGFGAGLPCRWQGWAVLAIYLVAIVMVAVFAGPYSVSHPIHYAVAIFIPTALVLLISWWKSDAPWRWRWGEAKNDGNR
ncbi:MULTISPECIES: hypothetical protein [unclassified Rhizobium]|uniref:hypothetical protein n=1 Tax=unclassified Rhizobium TaxID=2613769 RepID=UPI0018EDF6BF